MVLAPNLYIFLTVLVVPNSTHWKEVLFFGMFVCLCFFAFNIKDGDKPSNI